MATKPSYRDMDELLTAEISRQLALGNDTASLATLARETGLTERQVESCMGKYERQLNSPIRRLGTPGKGVDWQLREGAGDDGVE